MRTEHRLFGRRWRACSNARWATRRGGIGKAGRGLRAGRDASWFSAASRWWATTITSSTGALSRKADHSRGGRDGRTGSEAGHRQDGHDGGKDAEGNPLEFGHLVAPFTDGVDHDHFFSFRMDIDVDGPRTTSRWTSWCSTSCRRRARGRRFGRCRPRRMDNEGKAMQNISIEHPAMWRFVNPDGTTRWVIRPALRSCLG